MKSNIRAIHPQHWNRSRLKEILHGFCGRRILVIGDVGLDRYTEGRVERISPEAPVPIVAVTRELKKLGLAANVADNIQVLGGDPSLVGIIGQDRQAQSQVDPTVQHPTRRLHATIVRSAPGRH